MRKYKTFGKHGVYQDIKSRILLFQIQRYDYYDYSFSFELTTV